ncbi:MAG: leucine-rich repeat protein [Clostridia bacterium]|nr:leucine-rich repeat protein [Clostridia bacterium]
MRTFFKKGMALALALVLFLCAVPHFVIAETRTIVSIDVTTRENIKLTNGYWQPETDGTEWWYYYPEGFAEAVSVTMSDGSVYTSDSVGFIDIDGTTWWINYMLEQSAQSPLTVGTYTGTVYATADGVEYSDTYTATVIESPVASIVVDDITLIENIHGSEETYWNEETQSDCSYFYYHAHPLQYTVTMKDGTTFVYNQDDFIYNGEGFGHTWSCDQGSNDPWGVGTHTATINVLGFEQDYTVNIIENPVLSVEARDRTVYRGRDSWGTTDWDEETESWVEYTRYSDETTVIITMKDGTVIDTDTDTANYNGLDIDISFATDQSAKTPWDVGEHTATVTVWGVQDEYTVTVEDSPIASVEIPDITTTVQTGGWMDWSHSDELGNPIYYYRYSVWPEYYLVTMKDGTVLDSRTDEMWYNGFDLNIRDVRDDQSSLDPWGIGTHTVQAIICNVFYDFNVIIEESPVASIYVPDRSALEGTKGGFTTITTPDGIVTRFWRYDIDPEYYVVTMKDGTVLDSRTDEMIYNGEHLEYSLTNDQNENNPWGVGSHDVTISIAGTKFTYHVVIAESPIQSITVPDRTFIVNSNGYFTNGYANGEYVEYYEYSLSADTFTVTLKDGTVLDNRSDPMEYEGYYMHPEVVTDQSAAKPWGIGTYTASVFLMGVYQEFSVTIIESPVQSVVLDPIVLTENQNGDWEWYWDHEEGCEKQYFNYNLSSPSGTVTMKDGTTQSIDEYCNYVVYDGLQYGFEWTQQSAMGGLFLGDNQLGFTIAGYVGSAAITVSAEVSNGEFRYLEGPESILITDCYLESETVTIPSEIDGKPVTAVLGMTACGDRVMHLIFPDSVTTIGATLMDDLYNLETVTFGSGIKALSMAQFWSASYLQEINVSDDNPYFTSIDGILYDKEVTTVVVYPFGASKTYNVPDTVSDLSIFTQYSELTEVTLVVSETNPHFRYENGVLYNADKTKILSVSPDISGDYVMPDTVTELGQCVFAGRDQLTSVKLSSSLTEVVYGAFMDCSSLQSVILPDSIASIGFWAFGGTALTEFTQPKSLQFCDYSAFADCPDLTRVNLTDVEAWMQIDFYGDYANPMVGGAELYLNGERFTELVVPKSIQEIKAFAFVGGQLESVVIHDQVTDINYRAFYRTGLSSATIGRGVTYISSYAFAETDLTAIELPEGLLEIGGWCFSETPLASVNLPESLEFINAYAFYNTNLTEIQLRAGVYYDEFSFAGTKISSITIPADALLGDSAFANCDELTEIVFEEGVTAIPYNLFEDCDALTSVTIPAGITHIGDGAFMGCSSLTSVNFEGDVPEIGTSAFAYTAMDDFSWYFTEGMEFISPEAVAGTKITEITIPNTVTSIGYGAFKDCEDLLKIELPTELQYLGGQAFDNTAWYNAQPDGVTYLQHALYDYKGEMPENTAIRVKDGTTIIAENAFRYDRNLTEVVLPIGLQHIGNEAFSETGLTSVAIPSGMTELSAYVFSDCYDLTEVYLPLSLTYIDWDAFGWCSSLTDVWYEGTEEDRDNMQIYDDRLQNANWHYGSQMPCPHSYDHACDTDCNHCGEPREVAAHPYVDVITPPTLTEQGFTTHTCPICGDSYVDSYVDPLPLETAPQVVVSTASGAAGSLVEVTVSIKNHPGLIAMNLGIDYDSAFMTLVGVEDGGIFGTPMHSTADADLAKVPYTLSWQNFVAADNYTEDGVLVTLTFQLAEGLAFGDTSPVTVTYNYNNSDAIDKDGKPVVLAMVSGSVVAGLYGDVNADGVVDMLDGMILSRHLANWDGYDASALDMGAADVNRDGAVNLTDGMILSRYLAEWTGYEQLPYFQ